MSPSVETDRPAPEPASSGPAPHAHTEAESPWTRIKEHKVLQWSLAYLGAALALAHGQELLAHTYHWPELIGRAVMGVLIVGFPIALALAWYHGHKGMTRVSAGEMTVVSVMLVIGAGLLMALVRVPEEGAETQIHQSAQAAPAVTPALEQGSAALQADAPRASIAVIPFANLTGDVAKDYFSDGMAEELIDALAQVPGLKVPARTSSFAYKGRNADIRRIAQDLGVATILEGSVRSAGERIRVTAQLVDAKSGFHMWSHSFDRQFGDIFKLQDELAAAIVQALQEKMNAAISMPATPAPPTQDVQAYDLYLQARSLERRTESSFREAIALLDQALARDPRFAGALAQRAEFRADLVDLGYAPAGTLTDAERDVTHALALSPNLAEAHSAFAFVSALQSNWLQAEASMHAALAADASDPRLHEQHARLVLGPTGKIKQMALELSEAYRLAPADPIAAFGMAVRSTALGRAADTAKFADLAIELGNDPNAGGLAGIRGRAAAGLGRHEDAARYFAAALPASVRGDDGIEAMRIVYSGRADPTQKRAARTALQGLTAKVESAGMDVYTRVALIESFTRVGALDDAYELANEGLGQSGRSSTAVLGGWWSILWLPEMRAFRKDLRFQSLVTRLNMIDYWKQYGPPDECDLRGTKLTCR